MKLTFFTLLLIQFTPSPLSLKADEPKPEKKLIPTATKAIIENGDSVAISIGIISKGTTETFHAGEIILGKNQLPDSQTVYEIGSISKVFTAIMLAHEVTENKLKLNDPVSSILPKTLKMPDYQGHSIKLSHLATHTSRLPRLPNNLHAEADASNPYAHFDNAELKKSLPLNKLQSKPGGKPTSYSNYAMGLLGHALALNNKTTYPEMLEKSILSKLEMKSTTAELASKTTHLKRANGYDQAHENQTYWDFDALAAAGAIDSNLEDMLKFAQFCLNPNNSPLKPALELSLKPQIRTHGKGAQCLGWMLAADGTTYWHNGMTGGFSSYIAFNRKHNIAVCILSSGTSPHITALGEHLIRCAASGNKTKYNIQKSSITTKEQLEKLTGKYELTPKIFITVKTRNNRLFAKLTNQSYLELHPTSPLEFKYNEVKASLKFQPGKNLTLFQNGIEQVAKKTP